jgi:hypothetical protein
MRISRYRIANIFARPENVTRKERPAWRCFSRVASRKLSSKIARRRNFCQRDDILVTAQAPLPNLFGFDEKSSRADAAAAFRA